MTRYVLTSAPASLISLADAKAHLRVDHDDEDLVIDGSRAAAEQHLDGRFGVLGRALVEQTWRLETSRPCDGIIFLDLPPVRSIASVEYVADGIEAELPIDQWRLGYVGSRACVKLVTGAGWPASDDREDAWRVTFVAGYGEALEVPAPIRQAVLLLTGHYYVHREAVADARLVELPLAVDRLIAPYRTPVV